MTSNKSYRVDRIVSLDCESASLHGPVFIAAVSVQTRMLGEILNMTYRRHLNEDCLDPWVVENVIPACEHIPVNCDTADDMRQAWRMLYSSLKEQGFQVVCDTPWPVEAGFLNACHTNFPFTGPYPIIDIASMCVANGYDPMAPSVETVNVHAKATGVVVIPQRFPEGTAHDPLYDARLAAATFWALTGGIDG